MASNTEQTHLWTMIYDRLTSNAALVAALGHTAANKHIGRAIQRKHLLDPCITFHKQMTHVVANNDQPRILSLRTVYVMMSSFSQKTDAIAADNMDIAMEAIVGAVLSHSGYKTNPIEWDNFKSSPYYDENEQEYRQDCRLKIIIKECN